MPELKDIRTGRRCAGQGRTPEEALEKRLAEEKQGSDGSHRDVTERNSELEKQNRQRTVLKNLAERTMPILFIPGGMKKEMGSHEDQGDDQQDPENLAEFLLHITGLTVFNHFNPPDGRPRERRDESRSTLTLLRFLFHLGYRMK